MEIFSFLLGSAYGSFSPFMGTAASCNVNGVATVCPSLGILGPLAPLLFLAILVLTIVGMWKTFTKAGQPGWASIVPIYNLVVMLQIVKKPLWWIILYFIPLVNIIVSFIIMYELAKSFGKGVGFTIGLVVLPFVFYPILGLGKATYNGTASS